MYIVNDADAIIEGTVINNQVNKAYDGFSVTDYTIKVSQVYKGKPKDTVIVRTDGGSLPDIEVLPVENALTFKTGEKVVLFLMADKGDRTDKDDFDYFVLGDAQGKFKKEKGIKRNREKEQRGRCRFEIKLRCL